VQSRFWYRPGTSHWHIARPPDGGAPSRRASCGVVWLHCTGEGKRRSDIDILIELDPQAPVGLFEYVGIAQYLGDLFPVRVDFANRSSLKPLVRPGIERDAIYAF